MGLIKSWGFNVEQIPEPFLSKFLFSNTTLSPLWLILRLYVGWQWLLAGWSKLHDPIWVGQNSGAALQGFILGALKKSLGSHPDVAGWYGAFLNNVVLHNLVLFAHLVAWGEFVVGVLLILGLFTGIAAFLGAFMNMNYLFAGTVSINPLLFLIELFLILAWRVAGYYGLDYWVLPALGTPWYPGKVFKTKEKLSD